MLTCPSCELSTRPESAAIHGGSRRGGITIFAAITLIVLIALVGLSIDTAWVLTTRQEIQRTADAAALAAASKLAQTGQTNWDAVRQTAQSYSLANNAANRSVDLDLNYGNASTGDIVVGRWTVDPVTHVGSFTANTVNPNAVKVVPKFSTGAINNPLALFFGNLFGVPTAPVGRSAIAKRGSKGALIVVLEPTDKWALDVGGTSATLDVSEGEINVNSTNAAAFRVNSSAGVVKAQRVLVCGNASINNNNNVQGVLEVNWPTAAPDPLASLPEPTPNDPDPLVVGEPVLIDRGSITSGGPFQPGYYPGGILVNGSSTVTLDPGTYVFGNGNPGHGITLKSGASLIGNGVFLFIQPGADFSISTQSVFQCSPQTSGTYKGVVLFMARSTTNAVCTGGVFKFSGTIYVPTRTFTVDGTGSEYMGQIIANKLNLGGSGTYALTGDGTPTPKSVYLVQ